MHTETSMNLKNIRELTSEEIPNDYLVRQFFSGVSENIKIFEYAEKQKEPSL